MSVSAHIQNFRRNAEGRIEYFIKVEYHGKVWAVKKRYKEFVQLNKYLVMNRLPINYNLPPKNWWRNYDNDLLNHRQRELQQYLNHLLQVVATINEINSIIKEFFEVDEKNLEYARKQTQRGLDSQLKSMIVVKKFHTRLLDLHHPTDYLSFQRSQHDNQLLLSMNGKEVKRYRKLSYSQMKRRNGSLSKPTLFNRLEGPSLASISSPFDDKKNSPPSKVGKNFIGNSNSYSIATNRTHDRTMSNSSVHSVNEQDINAISTLIRNEKFTNIWIMHLKKYPEWFDHCQAIIEGYSNFPKSTFTRDDDRSSSNRSFRKSFVPLRLSECRKSCTQDYFNDVMNRTPDFTTVFNNDSNDPSKPTNLNDIMVGDILTEVLSKQRFHQILNIPINFLKCDLIPQREKSRSFSSQYRKDSHGDTQTTNFIQPSGLNNNSSSSIIRTTLYQNGSIGTEYTRTKKGYSDDYDALTSPSTTSSQDSLANVGKGILPPYLASVLIQQHALQEQIEVTDCIH